MAKKASKKKVEKESINESPENQVEDLKLEDQLKEEKDKFLQGIGIDMMIRIAALLPEEKQGPFFKNPNIKKRQLENGFIPNKTRNIKN